MKKCNLFYLSGLLFFVAAVLNLVAGGSLCAGGMALSWRLLFVSGAFAAEKIKQKASPGGGKIWPGLQFFAGLVRIPDKGTEFRQKTRYAYVNKSYQTRCRDPL